MGELINAALMKEMIVTAASYLDQNKQTINDLNVFPVPDGDTGTNMLMTIMSSAREVSAIDDGSSVGSVLKAMSSGALRGARGNSGVILSQLFRGFPNAVKEDTSEITTKDFAAAIAAGVESAYKAVMRPREGTILTVARSMAEASTQIAENESDFKPFLEQVISQAEETLQRTPDLLPVLKEAGVVDAGGAGLLTIFTGFLMALTGTKIETNLVFSKPKQVIKPVKASAKDDISTANIEFGYCSEFFIKNFKPGIKDKDIDVLRKKLADFGDSLVMVGDTEFLKVHVHSNNPGVVLQYALELGDLSDIKIENMREQHTELKWSEVEDEEIPAQEYTKDVCIVAVVAGKGLADILTDLDVDGIVPGGQSMNPSSEDIRKIVDSVPSGEVIVLPNNKNVILAAQQAQELTDKKIHVIPSKSFPQGLAAVLAFKPDADIEGNVSSMTEAISEVKSAEITRAVRDSHINGEDILKDEILGICEGDIIAHTPDLFETLTSLLDQMVTDDDSVISLFAGENVDEDMKSAVSSFIEERYSDCDVECYDGLQPVYDFIISVE